MILKRDNPGQEVPQRSLLEAAELAGLASWRAMDSKAQVMQALVADVRKVKGAALGQVRVDRSVSLNVDLDPATEDRLRITR